MADLGSDSEAGPGSRDHDDARPREMIPVTKMSERVSTAEPRTQTVRDGRRPYSTSSPEPRPRAAATMRPVNPSRGVVVMEDHGERVDVYDLMMPSYGGGRHGR
jgi:hypothetical protein